MKRLVSIALCLQIGFFALLAGAASYSPVYVDPATGDDGNDGSEEHPFKTLDKGLEVVGSSKHQALYLAPGTYKLNADASFGDSGNQGEQNNARLIGKTGNPDDVVIDGQGLYRWHQSGQNRGICSVTFSNLYSNTAQALRLDYYSGVVNYDDTTVRVFSNCVVKCCTAAGSELIQILGRTAMRDCKILNCTVTGSGKSIVYAKGGAQIDNCIFADNTAGGSIVELGYSSTARDKVCKSHIKGSRFLRNQASQIAYYIPIIDSCFFLTNTTSGSVCNYPQNYNFGAPLRILNTVFDKNETTSGVGCSGIDFHNSTLTNSLIENCVFANGSAPNGSASGSNNGHGGALRLYPTSLQGTGLTVRKCCFRGIETHLIPPPRRRAKGLRLLSSLIQLKFPVWGTLYLKIVRLSTISCGTTRAMARKSLPPFMLAWRATLASPLRTAYSAMLEKMEHMGTASSSRTARHTL